MFYKHTKKNIRFLLLISFVFAGVVNSAEFDYAVEFGLTSYDNVNLLNESAGKEQSYSLRGLLLYREDTSWHNTEISLDATYLDYKENIVDDEIDASLIAQSTIVINPTLFEWYVSNVFSRITIDPLEGASSDNLINTNAFQTGPNIFFRLNKSNNLNFRIRIEDYIFEESLIEDANNTRLTSAADVIHRFNSSSSLSLNFELGIVDYADESINSNYQRGDGYLGFDYERSIYRFNLETGYTNIVFDDKSLDEVREPRYLLSIRADRTRISNTGLELFQTTTDTSNSLLDQLNSDFSTANNASINSDLYRNTGGNVSYGRNTTGSNLRVRFDYLETRYNTLKDFNLDAYGVDVQFDSNINSTSGIAFNARYYQSTYLELSDDRIDTDTLYSLSYRLRLRRTINFRFTLEDESRNSTVEVQSYDDFRIRLSLEYVSL